MKAIILALGLLAIAISSVVFAEGTTSSRFASIFIKDSMGLQAYRKGDDFSKSPKNGLGFLDLPVEFAQAAHFHGSIQTDK